MPSFASSRVAALEAAYIANQGVIGLISVDIDGQTTQFSTLDALYQEYVRWKKRAARENGTRPIASQISLRGSF